MADVLVCNSNWNGTKHGSFNWHNNTSVDVTITQIPNTTWPFTIASPIPVAAGTKVACGLIDTPGTYPYQAVGCVDTRATTAKNVIIS
jgi:hypothetical protein